MTSSTKDKSAIYRKGIFIPLGKYLFLNSLQRVFLFVTRAILKLKNLLQHNLGSYRKLCLKPYQMSAGGGGLSGLIFVF